MIIAVLLLMMEHVNVLGIVVTLTNCHSESAVSAARKLFGRPAAVFRHGGRALGAVAASGGHRIHAAVLCSSISHLDYSIDPQRSNALPRLHLEHQELELDSRTDPAAIAHLRGLGLPIRLIDGVGIPTSFGRPSAVWRRQDGSLVPASDNRGVGVAAF